ncbi:hypothetical protein [Actinoplanes sp. L3-i22]|uniref:hypothetical protein n=1 Tax=Actinoplanes sp. L3-i22 TaxID=2836373 RepID=UPI001C865A0A|nr:hypothetical protein [Actinoplanes sp. L3-i22]
MTARPGRRAAEPPTRPLDWLAKYAIPLLTVGGAVLFGALRLAYFFFYQQLRATPEEVGYGYLEILSSQLVGTVELVALLTAALVMVNLGVRALRHAAGRRWQSMVSLPRRDVLARLVQRCGAVALIVVLTCLPILAWMFGTEAGNGITVRNIYLLHTVRIPVLAVQASPATVAWTSPDKPGPADLSRRRCLLYLGKADGITVFYDVATQEGLRVPSTQIMLDLPNVDSVPEHC